MRPSTTVAERSGDRVKRLLLQLGVSKPFTRGEILMLAGDPSNKVLLIEAGTVKVVLSSPNGSESIVAIYGPGELIGELGVISGDPRSASCIAQQDGCAAHVSGEDFLSILGRDADAVLFVNDLLRRRLRNADRRQLEMASRDVLGRVAAQLLDWARDHGEWHGTTVVVCGMTQRDLAQAITASEKTVDAALRTLRSAGLLETGRRRFTLHRPDLLQDRLGQPE